MQAEREKNLNIPIGLHGVRLACMQVHEVARPDSDSAVVKQEIHKATHAEQRDFARGGMARHAGSGGQRQPYHFETLCLQKGGGPDWPGRYLGQAEVSRRLRGGKARALRGAALTGLHRELSIPWSLQTCIVHPIRYSMQFASWPERKQIAAALRPLYRSDSAATAAARLEDFDVGPWGEK